MLFAHNEMQCRPQSVTLSTLYKLWNLKILNVARISFRKANFIHILKCKTCWSLFNFLLQVSKIHILLYFYQILTPSRFYLFKELVIILQINYNISVIYLKYMHLTLCKVWLVFIFIISLTSKVFVTTSD